MTALEPKANLDCSAAFAVQLISFLHANPQSRLQVRWPNGGSGLVMQAVRSARSLAPDEVEEYGGEAVRVRRSGAGKSQVISSRTAFEQIKQLLWLHPETRAYVLNSHPAEFYEKPRNQVKLSARSPLSAQSFATTVQQHNVRELRGLEIPNRCFIKS